MGIFTKNYLMCLNQMFRIPKLQKQKIYLWTVFLKVKQKLKFYSNLKLLNICLDQTCLIF